MVAMQCCPVQDRVEASPEQLASAMAAAEKLSEQSGMRVRVIGWYHSHPHITVLPSHVDVATQASYQQLDAGFIGIIFSTFNQVKAPEAQSVVLRGDVRTTGCHQALPAPCRSWKHCSTCSCWIQLADKLNSICCHKAPVCFSASSVCCRGRLQAASLLSF